MRRPWRTTAWSSASRTRIHVGSSSRTVVPSPSVEVTFSVPPSSVARSSIEVSPSRWPRTSGPSGSKPQPSSETLRISVPVLALQQDLDALGAGVADGVAERLLRDPQHLRRRVWRRAWARRRRRARSAGRPPAAAPRRACAGRWPGPRPPASAGRSSKTTARSSSIAPRASSETRLSSLAAPARSRSSSVEADSAASATPNSRWVTRVVQLTREPVALLDDAQLAAALVQARVLDRDRRVRGQQLDHLLVVERERRAVLLLGQVERADDLAAGDDRHAQEGPHHAGARAATSRGSAGRR